MRAARAALLLLLLDGCAIPHQAFECTDDQSCGAGGVCEPEGSCSVVDATCADTNRRFVTSAREDLAGTCVTACAEALHVGLDTSCVRLASGAMRCWGANDVGQLGGGAADGDPHPLPGGDTHAGLTTLSFGARHVCALRPAGGGSEVVCWGANDVGQLGTAASQALVIAPQVVTPASAVAAGAAHTCALVTGGSIVCWGDNTRGQLGTDTHPMVYVGPQTAVANAGAPFDGALVLAAGGNFTCATDSFMNCWGANESGQMGNDSIDDLDTISRVTAGTGPDGGQARLALGDAHACSTDADGIHCWGANQQGQLGRVDASGHPVPGLVAGAPTSVGALVAGARHTCVIDASDDSVWCWGDNGGGQLGVPEAGSSSVTPVRVTGLGPVDALAAGRAHTCALTSDGRVYCWGDNFRGQLGDGSTTMRDAPVRARLSCR